METQTKKKPRGMDTVTSMTGNPKINWKHLPETPLPFVNSVSGTGPGDATVQDPSRAYGYPYHNYYASWPKRCLQDPISMAVQCTDRNFIGPNYSNVYYTGPNFLDPVAQRPFGGPKELARADGAPMPAAFHTRPNLSVLGRDW